MRSFLGVPITVRGEVWGNLYLTEKAIGEFTQEDEDTAVVLADWSAVAINNARLYRDVRQRRDELQRANRGLETTTEITRALGGVTDLDRRTGARREALARADRRARRRARAARRRRARVRRRRG